MQLETHLGQYGYRPQGPLQQPEDPITSATHAGNSAVSGMDHYPTAVVVRDFPLSTVWTIEHQSFGPYDMYRLLYRVQFHRKSRNRFHTLAYTGSLRHGASHHVSASLCDHSCAGENPRLTSDTSDDEVQHMDVDMHFDTACASMKGDGSPLAKSSYSQAVPGGTGGDSPGDAGVGGRHGLRGKKLAGISVAPTTPHYVMSQEAKARLKARVKTPGLPVSV